MEEKLKVFVYSHVNFDLFCRGKDYNDENVDDVKDTAFISIIGTDDCLKYYNELDTTHHWFSREHDNVINLKFDDVEEDLDYKGYHFKTINEKQAEDLYKFIEKNLGKNFYIHCKAGKSRSQAVFSYIQSMYPNLYKDCVYNIQNPCLTPNQSVVRALKHQFYNEHGLFETE